MFPKVLPLARQPTHSRTHEKERIYRRMTPGRTCPRTTTKGRRAPRLFRPQKSSIAVVRHRSVLGVREDAHDRDRRFLWLKSDGSSPTLTETRAHNPTIHAFRDRVHNRISRKLPPRTTRTYKIPNASPKGMHPHKQYKNVPNKNKRDLSGNTINFQLH